MAPLGNGIFVIRVEMSTMMTTMKRSTRWNNNASSYQEEDHDELMKKFIELKAILNHIEDLRLTQPMVFLGPFLEVIRSEETTGPITSLALAAVNKFLSYGLIDPTHPNLSITVDKIADAVTHARFVGTDQASDGVVLLRIVYVLRTLMLNPEGSALTNESVCEIMLSCFRICFEPRLNELLRKNAEQTLKEIVQLLFMRLPQFSEERHAAGLLKKMIASGTIDQTTKKRKAKPKISTGSIRSNERKNSIKNEVNDKTIEDAQSPKPNSLVASLKAPVLATTPATPGLNIVDMQGSILQTPTSSLQCEMTSPDLAVDDQLNVVGVQENNVCDEIKPLQHQDSVDNDADIEDYVDNVKEDDAGKEPKGEDFINSMGVRFTPQSENDSPTSLTPYGLPCIRELLRFLISLCNPIDKQNTDAMIHMGLSLLTVALEVGADSIGNYDTLLNLVKDDMCKNLFALLNSERLTIFAADLQVCFLLFESQRSNLKFHLEYYLSKLSEIIASENPRTPSYEMRELALDNLLQCWRIPGFATELYINYDCNLYCTNLLEDLVKLLSKNALSATQNIYSIHRLSLDGLLSIIESIEQNCLASKVGKAIEVGRHSRNNSNAEKIVIDIPSGGESSGVDVENINNIINTSAHLKSKNGQFICWSPDQLVDIKNKKRILMQGTELFNQRPDKGIQFLQENGLLNTKLDPVEVVKFLRENSGLDKTMIGDYISKKKNVESKILETFVKSFDFANTDIDLALRQYLETFRLPGEAPLIFLVMEHFAEHWHTCNKEPFANTDSAFRLAYAIIMLNMDQHNYNAKRLNIPMTAEDFMKNLRGLNGNGDFNQELLSNIYTRIRNEEIIMPAEQTGLVRANYLWKVLLRRGETKDGIFNHVYGAKYDRELFKLCWGPTLSALSFMFDKSTDVTYQKALIGLSKGATISSHFNLYEDFDALVLTLCKFTTLLHVSPDVHEITASVGFGLNVKAQLAMKTVFGLIHDNGGCVRESWKCILDVIVQLFKLKLLSKSLIEVEDFCEPNGKVTLILEKPLPKTDAGLFSSLYSYLSSEGQRQPTYEEQEIIKVAKRCIRECQIDQIIAESKFLQFESLVEFIKCLLNALKPPKSHKFVEVPYAEDTTVFLMEFLVKILIQNRDRLLEVWPLCREQMYLLLIGSSSCGYQYLMVRTTVALLKLAIYLMRNEELCTVVLQSLKMFLMLKPTIILSVSKQISIGMYELLKTSAQNIHTEADWDIVFTILECVGAGATPPEFEETIVPNIGTKSDGALSSEEDSGIPDRGYTSDSELTLKNEHSNTPLISPTTENWIIVNKDSDVTTISCPTTPINTSLSYPCKLLAHSSFALVKCWDSLAFIVRNVAHITPYNFESCVKCIRTFVEASLNGGKYGQTSKADARRKSGRKEAPVKNKRKDDNNSSESEDEDLLQRYETIAIQLLDLMHTLHTRTAQIFRWWAEEGGTLPQCSALWAHGWCPLLQGIARLANDKRRQVRTSAVTCLQRALLVHDLKTLTGPEWASCFKQVLFPLLYDLLAETPQIIEPGLLEESRMRTATIMSKVFLHHLTPLIGISTFNELWLEIIDYLEKFMKVGSDMLYEAMLESLKNMLLVMHSVRVFHQSDGITHSPLWDTTWSRIGEFLPQLKDELFSNEVQQNHPVQNNMNVNAMMPTAILSPPADLQQSVIVSNIYPVYATTQASDAITSYNTCNHANQQHNFSDEIRTSSLLNQDQSSIQSTVPILMPHNPIEVVPPSAPVPALVQLSSPEILPVPVSTSVPLSAQESMSLSAQTSVSLSGQASVPLLSQSSIQLSAPGSASPATVPVAAIAMSLHQQNQYPSHTNVPVNIVRSYAPIFVQPQNQPSDADIYSDYVSNPYNLTLKANDENVIYVPIADDNNSPKVQKLGAVNVFQSANYFGSDVADIPPGSEMLFGKP